MKRFSLICAAILMTFVVVEAQGLNLIKARFSTPVTAGVTEMPAGNVTIQVLEVGSTMTVLVRSESGVQTTLLVNRLSRPANYNGPEAAVELARKGDAMILDRVWVSDTQGFEVVR